MKLLSRWKRRLQEAVATRDTPKHVERERRIVASGQCTVLHQCVNELEREIEVLRTDGPRLAVFLGLTQQQGFDLADELAVWARFNTA